MSKTKTENWKMAVGLHHQNRNLKLSKNPKSQYPKKFQRHQWSVPMLNDSKLHTQHHTAHQSICVNVFTEGLWLNI